MKKASMVARRSGLIAVAVGWMTIAGCGGGDDGTQVEEPVPTTVEISPDGALFRFINATQGFSAVVRDQNGKAMPDATISWSSSDAAVFTVSATGSTATVTAAGNGAATLTATSGQASGTASVEVEQTPARVDVVSGDEQEALRGTTLPEPLVVRVEDQGGTGVVGVQVTFLPDAGHGSVSETMVETDADGMASTEWTLGEDARWQSLVAFSTDFDTRFMATATSDPPIPDLMLEEFELSRLAPTVYETVDIQAVVTNDGDGRGPITFPVEISVAGTPVETIDVDALDPGNSTTLRFTIGPLEEGDHLIEVAIDPDDEIEEWGEDNNSGSESINVQGQPVVELGESVSVSSNVTGPVLLYRVEIDEASDEPLNVQLSGGTGDADLFVHYGERPNHQYYRCFSGNIDANESCQLSPTRQGVYHIAVHAYTAFGPSMLTVTVGGVELEPYDLGLEFIRGGTTSQRDIISQAADRWMSIIARDLNWDEPINIAAGRCGPDSPGLTGGVDDMVVLVMIDSIDGVGGSIGGAAPCHWRDYPFTAATGLELQPALGYMHLDRDDVDSWESEGVLLPVITHELAHALGFHEEFWARFGLLGNPSLPDNPNADTHFTGQVSIAAFDAAGGTSYAGAKVPVENGAERGVSDGNWRQSVFENELMTPFLTGEAQPLSAITIDAMYDLGYEVHLSEADPYTLTGAGVAGMALPRGRVIDLRGDMLPIPVKIRTPHRKVLK